MDSKEGQKSLAAIAPVPLGVIIRTVWNDLGEIFVRLRRQFIVALSIVTFFDFVASAPGISSNPVLSEAFDLMSRIGPVPFEIAIFRLLILDEAAPGYDFAISTVRFKRVLGWTVAFWAIGNIPIYLPGALASSEAAKVLVSIPLIVMIFAGIVVMLRIVILLPAIAPGASIRNVLADTRGHVWFMLKAYLAVLLPSILIIMLAAVLAWLGGGNDALSRTGTGAVAVTAIFSSLGFLVAITVAIVQARLFMRIGDRVKGSAESAGA